MTRVVLVLIFTSAVLVGCGKKGAADAMAPNVDTNSTATSAAPVPGPAPTPAQAEALPPADNMDAVLAQLTRELHRTMIGRKLSGSFDEFVAIRNLKVPPPPAGKKYAISKQWRVILVDAK